MSEELVVSDTGEIVDIPELPPGQVVPVKEPEAFNFEGIGTLELTPEQIGILTEAIPLEHLEIKPTGEVYASQVRYRDILNRAFGPGQWGLRPLSPFMVKDNQVSRHYALIVKGKTVSDAMGGQQYFPNNTRMSYSDAAEAAKSDALKRCCKDLGIASECWDRKFTEAFKKDNCLKVDGKWYLKALEGGEAEKINPGGSQTPPKQDSKPVDAVKVNNDVNEAWASQQITEKQAKRLYAIAKSVGWTAKDIELFLTKRTGQPNIEMLRTGDYQKICSDIEKGLTE